MRQLFLLGASSHYSHLEVTSGPLGCCFYVSKQVKRETQKWEAASGVCFTAPQGNGIIRYYTDSSGKQSVLKVISSAAPVVHQAILAAIILPDLWDDGGRTHQCLLNTGVNMLKDFLQSYNHKKRHPGDIQKFEFGCNSTKKHLLWHATSISQLKPKIDVTENK